MCKPAVLWSLSIRVATGVAACLIAFGCAIDLGLPEDANVGCSIDDNCPSGWVCSEGVCVDPQRNTPPILTVLSIGSSGSRPLDNIEVRLGLRDNDDDPTSVTLEFQVDGMDAWVPASVDPVLEDVSAPPSGAEHTIRWQALADSASVEQLHSVLAPTSLDESVTAALLAGDQRVRLRLTPRDADASGQTVETEFLSVGNSPPEVTLTPLAPGEYSAAVLLGYSVMDTNADAASVEFQFRVGNEPWRAIDVALGEALDLATSKDTPREYQVVWQSDSLPQIDPTVPQGVGIANVSAQVRARASDSMQGARFYGSWSTPIDVELHNDNLPPLLAVTNTPATANGDFIVTYELSDAESDVAAIFVEVFDGTQWLGAIEGVGGNGTFGLTTDAAPQSFSYAWSSTQLGFDTYSGIRLRFTPFDSEQGPTVETPPFDVDNRQVNNIAPSASIASVYESMAVGRPMRQVGFDVLVSDPNGDGPSGDTVSLALELWDGAAYIQQNYTGAVFQAGAPSEVNGLAAPSPGQLYSFVWMADSALPFQQLDTDGDGTAEETVLVPGTIRLRVVVSDDASTPGSSPSVPVDFDAGNDPPVATLLARGVIADDTALTFELTDTQDDLADVELQFRQGPADVWRSALLVAGATESLVTTQLPGPVARQYVVVWDSSASPNDANPSSPQGVGAVDLSTLELRVRAIDSPGDPTTSYFGPWHELTALNVDNQSPPQVVSLSSPRTDFLGGAGTADIYFQLVDEEGDVADVLIEYSLGGEWRPCQEYPSAKSGGSRNLATTSPAEGGVTHTFIWDTSGAAFRVNGATRLRITAADVHGAGSPVEIPLIRPPWEAKTFPFPFGSKTNTGGGHAGSTRLVDFGQGGVELMSINRQRANGTTCIANGEMDLIVVQYLDAAGAVINTFQFDPLGFDDGCGGGREWSHMTELTSADFNEDLVPDYAVSYSWDGGQPNIDMVVGLGGETSPGSGAWDQTFSGPATYNGGTDCVSIDSGDVDGDGVIDIVTACSDEALVWWGIGSVADPTVGTGTFSSTPLVVPMAPRLSRVRLGDFNGDGTLDIAVAGNGDHLGHDGGISVSLNQGGRTFGPVTDYAPLGDPRDLKVTDLNEDGVPDMVAAKWSSLLSVLIGRGDGTFDHVTDVVTGAPELGVYLSSAVAAGDVNGDGIVDLVASTSLAVSQGSIWVHLGVPNAYGVGGYQYLKGVGLPAGPDHDDMILHDFDGDGYLDLVTNQNNGNVNGPFMYFSQGPTPPTFEYSSSAPVAAGELYSGGWTIYGPSGHAFAGTADLNRDGVIDILTGRGFLGDEHEFTFGYGAGSGIGGALYESTLSATYPAVAAPWLNYAADLNGDGITDLVSMGAFQTVEVLTAQADAGGLWDGTFTHDPFLGDGLGEIDDPQSVDTGDTNGDGYPDIITTSHFCKLVVFESQTNAGGTFTGYDYTELPTVGGPPKDVELADVDNDGYDDVITAGLGSNMYCGGTATDAVKVYLTAPGGGSWGPEAIIDGAETDWVNIVVEDFNNDGYTDIVAAPEGGGGVPDQVWMWSGLGGGTFSVVAQTSSVQTTGFLASADLNGDGAMDLVTAKDGATATDAATVYFLINQLSDGLGTGAFALHAQTTVDGYVRGMMFEDFNGDGAPDLLALRGGTEQSITWQVPGNGAPLSSRGFHRSAVAPGSTSFVGVDLLTVNFADNFGNETAPVLVRHVEQRPSASISDATLLPVTPTYIIGGDRRLTAVVTDVGGVPHERRRVENRYGDPVAPDTDDYDRGGLSNAEGRGFVFELPIAPAHAAAAAAGPVTLMRRSSRWRRADEYSLDPMFGQPDAGRYLACRGDVSGCTEHIYDAVSTEDSLAETTDPAFSTLNVDRFYVDTSNPNAPVIRIWATTLGHFRAFVPVP